MANGIRTRVSTLRRWVDHRLATLNWAFGALSGHSAVGVGTCGGRSVGEMLAGQTSSSGAGETIPETSFP